MFGNAKWFSKGRRVGRVRPRSFKGWLYVGGWSAALLLPALVLAGFGRAPEAGIWFLLMSLAWWLDFRPVRHAVWRGAPGDLFVIDENTDITHLTTRNYDISLRG